MTSHRPRRALRPSDSESTPARYHHGDLRNALIEAGQRLLAERGAESLSLREISQHAGVSHTAAYRHYADKEALLADLAEHGFRELQSLLDQTRAQQRSPAAQLSACGHRYVAFGRHHPQLIRLMFGGAIVSWDKHAALAAAGRRLSETLAEIIAAGQAAGELKAGNAAELALAAWAQVHGLALLMADRRIPHLPDSPAALDRISQACIEWLMRGLRSDARPARRPRKIGA